MLKLIDFIVINAGWIIAVIAFCIPPIRDFVIKKFQLSIDKALEDKKSINERKNYISKTKFDTEFKIYRELSKAFYTMVNCVYTLIPPISAVPSNTDDMVKQKKELSEKAISAYVSAQDSLYENASFISDELYKAYQEILVICNRQLVIYNLYLNEKLPMDAYNNSMKLKQKFEDLNNKVRVYLSNLDVL